MRRLREWCRRLLGTVTRTRTDDDLADELRMHLEMEAEAARQRGTPPDEAARAARLRAGALTQAMEAVRDQRSLPRLDALVLDVTFGWRQLRKHPAVSLAAVFSLGIAIGATTAAFRVIDAVLLRPLPIAHPDRFSEVVTTSLDAQGRPDPSDQFDYPTYERYAGVVRDRADLFVIGTSAPAEVQIGGPDPERVHRQFVSGNVFSAFGLTPALGRLIVPGDDANGPHPVVVLSYDYWTRRFAGDAGIIGRTIGAAGGPLEIVGVTPKGFTGTEPGTLTDMFEPASMNAQALASPGWTWFRLWVRPHDGVTLGEVQAPLQAALMTARREQARTFAPDVPQARIDAFLAAGIALEPVGSGASDVKTSLERPLWMLGALVLFVLLIACANVANLMTASTAMRSREMALRVAIGAGRARLVQLVFVESAILAMAASGVGVLFARWSTPFVVALLAPERAPVRLELDADWRVLAFGVALTLAVTALFGLPSAWRASGVSPVHALKSGAQRTAQSHLAQWLVAAQMAFCVFVVVAATLFIVTFAHLSTTPLGFSADNVVVLDAATRGNAAASRWTETIGRLGAAPGVERAAISGWAPLSSNGWTMLVTVAGRPVDSRAPYFLAVGPGFFDTLRIPLIEGRDIGPDDRAPAVDPTAGPLPGVGVVNESFARAYFDGRSPVGRVVSVRTPAGAGGSAPWTDVPMTIVGLAGDAAYRSVREPMRPTVYVPIGARANAAVLVRASSDPLSLVPALRSRLRQLWGADVRVQDAGLERDLVREQMTRERLLATLSIFFAGVALLLSGIGVYGTLTHAVIQQHRDIGVRLALGASPVDVVRRVTSRLLGFAAIGAGIGLAAGLLCGRLAESVLFMIAPTDPAAILVPLTVLVVTAALAVLSPAVRAAHVDPVRALRSE